MNTMRWFFIIAGFAAMFTLGYFMASGTEPKPAEKSGPWTEYQDAAKKDVELDFVDPFATARTAPANAEWVDEANKKNAEREAARTNAELVADAVVDEQERREATKPIPIRY